MVQAFPSPLPFLKPAIGQAELTVNKLSDVEILRQPEPYQSTTVQPQSSHPAFDDQRMVSPVPGGTAADVGLSSAPWDLFATQLAGVAAMFGVRPSSSSPSSHVFLCSTLLHSIFLAGRDG